MKLRLLLSTLIIALSLPASAIYRYVGGDISLLPDYEKAGAQYKDHSGKKINDLLPFLYDAGMNAMRVRLFVNPADYTGSDKDPNACQDLAYITPLCKRIVDAGFALMLDFHYSDTWADPAKQWTPKAWANLTDTELYQKIYDYTKESLETLAEAGVVPDFIQPGNEISYGMLWGPYGTSSPKKAFMGSTANWDRFTTLLKRAIDACREVCPKAKIILHTERVAQTNVQKNFYDKMKAAGVDYDIVGLSYYPYFHGNMATLKAALNQLTADYPDKDIMIVETGYSYKWEVPGTDKTVDYAYSDEGQAAFARDLVDLLRSYARVNGLFWWWMEYNAYGTNLGGWYNAPLFDSTTGRATTALTTICSFADGNAGISAPQPQPQAVTYYNLFGQPVANPTAPGIYISSDGRKIVVQASSLHVK